MLGAHLTPAAYLRRCAEVFETLDLTQVAALADDVYAVYEAGRLLFICGSPVSGSN